MRQLIKSDKFDKLFFRINENGRAVGSLFVLGLTIVLVSLQSSLFAQAVSDRLDWQTDVNATISKAQPGKIVVLVQFDCDFLKPVLDSEEFKNFRGHCLDEPAKKWLNENSQLICEAVGFPSEQIKLDFNKAKAPNEAQPARELRSSTGTCVVWFCDFNGIVCDLLVGLPSPKLLIEKAQKVSKFLNENSQRSLEEFRKWARAGVQPSDQEYYAQTHRLLLANTNVRNASSLSEIQAVKYSVVAAARSRELWMEERFGGNWNRITLNRFAGLENQFFSMMLANVPFQNVGTLERYVWELVIGKRFWKVDREALAHWIETQRSQQRSLLLRFDDRSHNDEVWPKPGDSKLSVQVEQSVLLPDSSPADAAYILSYLNAGPLTISAHHIPTYFISTCNGDRCHLLTERDDKQLTNLLTTINNIQARRKK